MLTLTQEELFELTGFKQMRRQIESLGVLGYPFRINGAGRVIVLRTDVLSECSADGEHEEEPDYDAI